MEANQYVQMFDELGIYDHQGVPNCGRKLKHPGVDLPSLYFNSNPAVDVYFAAYTKDERHFPVHLWGRIPDNLVKSRDRQSAGGLPVVPQAGTERRAFEFLVDSLE